MSIPGVMTPAEIKELRKDAEESDNGYIDSQQVLRLIDTLDILQDTIKVMYEELLYGAF